MSNSKGSNSGLRILDANGNRAREALRVMEEFVRLGLDDALLGRAIKDTRHDLANAMQTMGVKLIGARDILGDVGCEVHTADEYQRASAEEVALTSCKRLSEALRTIEEYGKIIDPQFARTVEKIRYRGYELERRLGVTITARKCLTNAKLYVIITEALCKGDWFETARAALRGGADILQLREKHLPDGELLERAKRLADLCHDSEALLIINDRPDIAEACLADGVHLGQDDLAVSDARRIVPPRMLIGLSTHTYQQVEQAAIQTPDYLAVGPMFETQTKPQNHIAGPETLQAARKMTSLPLVAIGGLNEGNVGLVNEVAPCLACVCQAIIGSDDPAGSAAAIKEKLS